MTRELMEDANVAMRRGSKLEQVSHMGNSPPFLGLSEDIEVAIRGLKTKHPIFVIEAGDHNLELVQPFLNFVKHNQEYKPDGVFDTIMYPHTYRTAVFQTLASQDPANQRENQIFLHSLN